MASMLRSLQLHTQMQIDQIGMCCQITLCLAEACLADLCSVYSKTCPAFFSAIHSFYQLGYPLDDDCKGIIKAEYNLESNTTLAFKEEH